MIVKQNVRLLEKGNEAFLHMSLSKCSPRFSVTMLYFKAGLTPFETCPNARHTHITKTKKNAGFTETAW